MIWNRKTVSRPFVRFFFRLVGNTRARFTIQMSLTSFLFSFFLHRNGPRAGSTPTYQYNNIIRFIILLYSIRKPQPKKKYKSLPVRARFAGRNILCIFPSPSIIVYQYTMMWRRGVWRNGVAGGSLSVGMHIHASCARRQMLRLA